MDSRTRKNKLKFIKIIQILHIEDEAIYFWSLRAMKSKKLADSDVLKV